jgi:methyltransferase (TIGR00027 family)
MPSNLVKSTHNKKTSDSALRVAELRAIHQLLDEPVVFDDPLALSILGTQHEAALRADPFVFNDPLLRGMRALLAVRSRLAEEELARAVTNGVRQYVVLGAGLDTFAYRNPHASLGLQVYEVDHAATQASKKAMLQSAGINVPESVTFVGVDFEGDELPEQLQGAGFQTDAPACFSWLGVTVYLTPEAIFNTLRWVASLPSRTSITFDYRIHPTLLNPIDMLLGEVVGKAMAERGEPWISSFDPPVFEQQLRTLGYSLVTSLAPDQLNARYLARRKDGLFVGNTFRLMSATV